MTVPPTFPSLPGITVPMPKRPRWSTRIATHESGREVRLKRWKYPLWTFEITVDAVTSASQRLNLIANSQQAIVDFFQQCQGAGNSFLYVDQIDTIAVGQTLGIADGVTTDFVFKRMLQSVNEPVGWLLNVAAVYIDGVQQTSGWNTYDPNVLRFATAPKLGTITADFNFAFLCRFSEDEMDSVQFMRDLWEMRSIKFQSLRSALV